MRQPSEIASVGDEATLPFKLLTREQPSSKQSRLNAIAENKPTIRRQKESIPYYSKMAGAMTLYKWDSSPALSE